MIALGNPSLQDVESRWVIALYSSILGGILVVSFQPGLIE
jgi:hypothetical protein